MGIFDLRCDYCQRYFPTHENHWCEEKEKARLDYESKRIEKLVDEAWERNR